MTSTTTDEKVDIFGGNVPDDLKKDKSDMVFGVLLLYSGVILLFNSLGVIPWIYWQYIWPYWPVLVVLGGLHIIVGNGFFARILMSVAAIFVIGLVFLTALDAVTPWFVRMFPEQVQYVLIQWKGILR